MIILGVDPGLAATGYGVIRVQGSRYSHVCHGVIRTPAGLEVAQRLLLIRNGLLQVVQTHRPQEAGIETLYFGRNVGSAVPVAEARGVVLCTLAGEDIACYEYNPKIIKQAVVGSGRAEKAQVQEMIRRIFRLSEAPPSDHAADALAAAFCHSTYGHIARLAARGTSVQ